FLNAAGGNQYKIGALYKKKEVHSALVLESRRKLLYQVMSMAGIAAGSTASLEAAFWQPSKKYFIEMKKQGPVASIKHFPVLDGTNRSDFIRAAAKGYTLKKYKPYAFAVAFVEYIAKPEPVTIEKEVSFTLPGKTAKW